MSIFKISLQIYEFILTFIFIHFISVKRYFIRQAGSCLFSVNSVFFVVFTPNASPFFLYVEYRNVHTFVATQYVSMPRYVSISPKNT